MENVMSKLKNLSLFIAVIAGICGFQNGVDAGFFSGIKNKITGKVTGATCAESFCKSSSTIAPCLKTCTNYAGIASQHPNCFNDALIAGFPCATQEGWDAALSVHDGDADTINASYPKCYAAAETAGFVKAPEDGDTGDDTGNDDDSANQ